MRNGLRGALLVSMVAGLVGVAAFAADETSTPANEGFFDGDYVIIGQGVANGPVYRGTAHIETLAHHQLRLSRKINNATFVEKGMLVSDSMGNESRTPMPKFTWRDAHGDGEMFCYFTSNFDNYPILSCYRYHVKNQKGPPGLESYYPAASAR
ncbi:MAG TPA: hypothetical protein VJN67_00460 [Stellaceae bacterium]|nr:hypothetical protein [Stellaceae bacterium]